MYAISSYQYILTNLTFSENPLLRSFFLQQIYVLKYLRNDVINVLWNQTKAITCLLHCILARERLLQSDTSRSQTSQTYDT